MNEITNRCTDRCIEDGNLEKALYYKWLRVDAIQRDLGSLEGVKIG